MELRKWAPTSSATIHNLPYGQIDARSCVDIFSYRSFRRNFLRRFCEAMSGFAKLLSPKGKLWIVALLVGALQLITPLD